MKENDTTITVKKTTLLWGALVVAVAIIVYLSFFTGPAGQVNPGPAQQPSVGSATGSVKVSLDDSDPVLGELDAPITVIEFSDFECPFCARAATDTVASLEASDMFKNGDVNFVYKHFPLNSIHRNAQKAAEASVCADEQGKFWEYHDELFANQGSLDVASLKSYAQTLGLDTQAFNDCLDSGDAAAKVNKDLKMATDSGGRGTPYFVIYNKDTKATATVSGAVPLSQIEAAIAQVK